MSHPGLRVTTTGDSTNIDRADPSLLEAQLASLIGAEPRRWIHVVPSASDEQLLSLADRSGVAGWFSGRGSDLPQATFVPPDSLGISHGKGAKAVARLAAAGVKPPEGVHVVQDHAKRGLVLTVQPSAPVEPLARFILDALATLLDRPWFDGRFDTQEIRSGRS